MMYQPTWFRSLLIRLASLFFFFRRRLMREELTTMTKDTGLKSKTDRGATGFKFNQNLRTLMILMGLFVAALLVAPLLQRGFQEEVTHKRSRSFRGSKWSPTKRW